MQCTIAMRSPSFSSSVPSPLRTDSVLPLDEPEAAAGPDDSEEPPPPPLVEAAAFLSRTLRRKLETGSLVLYVQGGPAGWLIRTEIILNAAYEISFCFLVALGQAARFYRFIFSEVSLTISFLPGGRVAVSL